MMKSVTELLDNITPDIYQNLKRAVELGKWPNGEKVSNDQRSLCMQAVIAYEKKHLPPEQQTGYIDTKKHTHCGSTTGEVSMGETDVDEEKPLNFK